MLSLDSRSLIILYGLGFDYSIFRKQFVRIQISVFRDKTTFSKFAAAITIILQL